LSGQHVWPSRHQLRSERVNLVQVDRRYAV